MSTEKINAAKNVIGRMKQAGSLQVTGEPTADTTIPTAVEFIPVADAELTEIGTAAAPMAQPLTAPFYMLQKGEKFYCMQRMGSHDVEHASFFKEAKCRGHIFNSHGIIV